MKTITPFELQILIDQGPVELIDVRPKRDFEWLHAVTARSIPLSSFEPHSVLVHRKLDRHAPLYIMCRRKTLASLAACGLTGAGLEEPIVVKGGLEAWEEQCLPVVGKKSWRLPRVFAQVITPLARLTSFLSLAFHGLLRLVSFAFSAVWTVSVALGSFRARGDGHHWAVVRTSEGR